MIPQISSGNRPGHMSDTPAIAGLPAGSHLRLLDTGLPFTAYYPEDELILQQNSSDEGIGLRFVGNYGGRKNDSISIHFFFPSVAATLSEITEYVTGEHGAVKAAEWNVTGPATMSCPWANVSYLYTDTRQPGTGGAICIGQHRGGAFYMITHYPAAHAGAVETTLARILSHLRWKDTGTDLRKE
jgi:hypothetical protein